MKKLYMLYDGDLAYSLTQANDLEEFNHLKEAGEQLVASGERKVLKVKYDQDLYILESTELMDEDYMRETKKGKLPPFDLDVSDWPDEAVKLLALSEYMLFIEDMLNVLN